MRHEQRNSKKPKAVQEKRKQKYCIDCRREQRYLSKHLQKQHGYIRKEPNSSGGHQRDRNLFMARQTLASRSMWTVSESETVSEIDETFVHETINIQLEEKKRENNSSLKKSLTVKRVHDRNNEHLFE